MNAITLINEKDWLLKDRLTAIDAEYTELAMKNIQQAQGLSGPNAMAVLEFEKLLLTKEQDLLTIMYRGERLAQIEKFTLWAHHPEGFNSLEEAAQVKAGLSKSQISNIKDLYTIVFPYVESLGMSIVEFWSNVNQSNLREIIPYLKVLITGELSKRQSVNDAVDVIRDDVLALVGDNQTKDELDMMVFDRIIDLAANTTNAGLREALRPSDHTPIPAILTTRNGHNYLVAQMDDSERERLIATNNSKRPLFDIYYPQHDAEDECRLLTRLTGED